MNKYRFVKMLPMLLAFYACSLEAHTQKMHQHITREAFNLLKKSFPDSLNEMESFLCREGSLPQNPPQFHDEKYNCLAGVGSNSTHGTILDGAWIEDDGAFLS